MTTIDDLAHFYLDFVEALNLRDVILVGCSFGGWLAAEIATKTTERISHVVLSDAVGIKVSGREQSDIVDFFATKRSTLSELAYHDAKNVPTEADALSDDEARALFRNRESAALFAWSPYMCNPKLKSRLHRIKVPTLVLWGASDRITLPDYGRAYAAEIPGARFELIDQAGHFPQFEQPAAFSRQIQNFVQGTRTASVAA